MDGQAGGGQADCDRLWVVRLTVTDRLGVVRLTLTGWWWSDSDKLWVVRLTLTGCGWSG